MKYYLTTDTHFSHPTILKYCERPIDYEQRIVNGWKNLIPGQHVLIHLGDICMSQPTEVHEKYIIPLKVKKILVRGNHDSKSDTWYLEHGWDWVCGSMTTERGGKKILFSHEPKWWDGSYELNIHGHLHNLCHPELNGIPKGGHKLLALEGTDYRPWDLDKIIEETI